MTIILTPQICSWDMHVAYNRVKNLSTTHLLLMYIGMGSAR